MLFPLVIRKRILRARASGLTITGTWITLPFQLTITGPKITESESRELTNWIFACGRYSPSFPKAPESFAGANTSIAIVIPGANASGWRWAIFIWEKLISEVQSRRAPSRKYVARLEDT